MRKTARPTSKPQDIMGLFCEICQQPCVGMVVAYITSIYGITQSLCRLLLICISSAVLQQMVDAKSWDSSYLSKAV
ncbi:MAG: hypothetical protein H5T98_03635 [Syntrophomonadaceae bacterium]|nr:hypothetical protein [Syntrophomonadaceae bacterium]